MHNHRASTQSTSNGEVCKSTATAAEEEVVSDKICNEKEETDATCKSELQLLPPPTSWFQPEQNIDSCSKDDSDQASSGNEALSDSSESVLDDYDCKVVKVFL